MSIQLELPFPPEVEWRNIPGYVGYYQVSNTGLIRAVSRCLRFFTNPRYGWLDRHGYTRITLCREGKVKTRGIHQLVMAAFKGVCPTGYEVNHMNFVKNDNRPENLEYVTPVENKVHYWLKHISVKKIGKVSHPAKLTDEDVRAIRKLHAGGIAGREIAERLGVHDSTVSRVLSRKIYRNVE